MNETDYHRLADAEFNHLSDMLCAADESGLLDMEYQNGVMTISFSIQKQYIINKHAVSREIWMSSPVSGGLHFAYADDAWRVADGRALAEVLAAELRQAGVML